MKEITLRNSGLVAIVDDEDYDLVFGFPWIATGGKWNTYAKFGYGPRTARKHELMHRMITGCPDGFEVDHINHNGLDNRKENLRVVDSSQNKWNQRIKSNNKSGFKGVHYDNRRQRFVASIQVGKKRLYLGVCRDILDAAKAYEDAAKKLHKEYYCLG